MFIYYYVLDVTAGKCFKALEGHNYTILSLAISLDNSKTLKEHTDHANSVEYLS